MSPAAFFAHILSALLLLTPLAIAPILVLVKVREAVRMLQEDGWYLARTSGSHHQFKHPTKKGLVTVPGNRNDDLAPGTINSFLKQAGLKK